MSKRRIKRKAGDINPPKVTKLEILTYLLDGKKNTIQIRDYLKETLNITEKKNIYLHLTQLEDRELIVKEKGEKGFADLYFLKNDYNGLRNNFIFFSNENKSNIFLKSEYAQESINEDLFTEFSRDLIRAILKPTIDIMKMDDDEIKNHPEYNFFYDEINNEKNQLEILKQNQKDFDLSEYDEKKVEEFLDQLFNCENDDFNPISMMITLLLFPINERKEIIEILKCSPSSMNFIVSLQDKNFKYSLTLFSTYFRYYFQNIVSFSAQAESDKENEKSNEEMIGNMLTSLSNLNRKVSSPILVILKSLLTSDYFNSNIIHTKWVSKYLLDLFIDDENIRNYYHNQIEESDSEVSK